MPTDVSLSDSKCWNGGHEWVLNRNARWLSHVNFGPFLQLTRTRGFEVSQSYATRLIEISIQSMYVFQIRQKYLLNLVKINLNQIVFTFYNFR